MHPLRQLRILINIQATVRRRGVQGLGNQQVNIVVVRFQRSKAGGVVTYVKCRAQRIVILRNFAQRRDLALPSASRRFGFGLRWDGVQSPVRGCLQNIRQFRVAEHVYQKDYEHKREKSARNFQYATRATPASALLIIENRLAFRHSGNPS